MAASVGSPSTKLLNRPTHQSTSVVITERQLKDLVGVYSDFEALAFDFETMGEKRNDPRHAQPFWISMAGPGRADVIPFGHPLGDMSHWEIPMTKDGSRPLKNRKPIPHYDPPPEHLSAEVVFAALEPIMFGPALKIGHNLKFDLEVAAKAYEGRVPTLGYYDTQIAAFLINEMYFGGFPYSLGSCVQREFKYVYDKSLGRIGVEKFPFSEAANYSWHDAKYTWLLYQRYVRRIEAAGLEALFALEMRVLQCVVWMEQAGVTIDVDALDALDVSLTKQLAETYAQIKTTAGWEINVNSDDQVRKLLFADRGHKPHPGYVTKQKRVPQVSAAALTATASLRKDSAAKAIIKWNELAKLHSTYALAIKNRLYNGRLHADFDQRGARTGRFSCVSGATILQTSRGEFRFDEYQPLEGDFVQTHTGALQRVVRKIYKGRDMMFRVALSNGAVIECTQEHRLLTPEGWAYVRDLRPGSVVWSYGGLEELRGRSAECGLRAGGLLRRRQADDAGDGPAGGDDVPQRAVHHQSAPVARAGQGREGTAVFPVEDGRAEPDAPQEWFPAPQLQGADPRRARLSSEEDQRGVRALASGGVPAGASEAWFQFFRRASHRRRQAQQFARQSGVGDTQWAPGLTCQAVEVREITPLGPMGVWDIEVERDHSYVAQGFLNHNCRNPNLQNIPTRKSKEVRDLFVAPSGHKLIVADYSQIELRVLAHYTRDPLLIQVYQEGLNLHTITAQRAYHIEDPTPDQYSRAKNVNFCVPLDTQALTPEGWVTHDRLQPGDQVLGYEDGVLVWTAVKAKHYFDDADLVELRGNNFRATTTEGHRWIAQVRRPQREVVTTTGTLTGEHCLILSAPAVIGGELDITPEEAAVIAWLLCDGSIIRSEATGARQQAGGRRAKFQATIWQKKAAGIMEIERVLACIRYRRLTERPTGIVGFRIQPDDIRALWGRAGIDKTGLEQFVMRLSPTARQAFVDAAWHAEGWMNAGSSRILAQNDGPVLEALRLAIFLTGKRPTASSNGMYKGVTNWNLNFSSPRVTGQRLKRTMIGGPVSVWCPETETGTWVMRQGDQIMLTGNSMAYGAQASTLVEKYGVPNLTEAQDLIDAFFSTYKRVDPWRRSVIRRCRETRTQGARPVVPYVTTILGRKRHLPDLFSHEFGKQKAAERQAVNTKIQGSAGDILKVAMAGLYDDLAGSQVVLMLTVHDELVAQAPDSEAEEAATIIRQRMEGVELPVALRVPLVADVTICTKWSEK